MWDNRCKIAVSGVGSRARRARRKFRWRRMRWKRSRPPSKIPGWHGGYRRPGDLSGAAGDGSRDVDGISIVSVNCMMAMLKLPNLTWHIQVGSVNIGGAVQQAVNALLAGVCKYAVVWRAMHNPRAPIKTCPGTFAQGPTQFTAPYGFGGPGQGMAVAYTRWLEKHNQNREKMATLAVTQRKHGHKNPHAYFYKDAADARGLSQLPHGRLSVLSLRLRYPGAGSGRHRAHDR